jgi:hypothetical protein
VWCSLFISSVATLYILSWDSRRKNIKYYIIQEIFTWLFLTCLFNSSPSLAGATLIIKLGLPPFHSWFLEVLIKRGPNTRWILSINKLVPSLIIMWFYSKDISFFIYTIIFFRAFNVIGSLDTIVIFNYRGSINTLWSILSAGHSLLSAALYFIFYTLLVYHLIPLGGESWGGDTSLLLFTGLPPRVLFFIKLVLVIEISRNYFFRTIIFLITSTALFIAYFRLWEIKCYSLTTTIIRSYNHTEGLELLFTSIFLILLTML